MNFEEIMATINQSNDFIIHERELKSQPFAVVTSEGQSALAQYINAERLWSGFCR